MPFGWMKGDGTQSDEHDNRLSQDSDTKNANYIENEDEDPNDDQ